MQERRATPRAPFEGRVTTVCERGAVLSRGLDLSGGGIALRAEPHLRRALASGGPVLVYFEVPGEAEPRLCFARASSVEGGRAGLTFERHAS